MNNQENVILDSIVKQKTLLIMSRSEMNRKELEIFLLFVSQLPIKTKVSEADGFTIDVQQVKKVFTESQNRPDYLVFREMLKAVKGLYEKSIAIPLDTKSNEEEHFLFSRIIGSFEIHNKSITVNFTNKIIPYISNLNNDFVKYRLRHVVNLKNTHAIKLYQHICRWHWEQGMSGEGIVTTTIAELRKYLDVNEVANGKEKIVSAKYSQSSHFNKLLRQCVTQINNHSDYKIELKRKNRNETVQIRFEQNPDFYNAEKIRQEKYNFDKQQKKEQKQKELDEQNEKQKKEEVNKKIEEFNSMPDGTKYLDSEGVTYLKDKNILVGENGKKLIRKNIILLFMEGDLEKIS